MFRDISVVKYIFMDGGHDTDITMNITMYISYHAITDKIINKYTCVININLDYFDLDMIVGQYITVKS